jgi:HEPN domain-containing protein
MSAARKTRSVSPQAARNYLKKAQEFNATMKTALAACHWNAAALSAVHAAISAGDALLAAFASIRSAEQDHRQIVTMLADQLGKDGEQASRHVQRVIARKNLVEYEERLITESDARQMATHVERLMKLVEAKLPTIK